MGRRTSLAALAGDAVEDVPGTSDLTLLHVPLDKLVATRFNPRRNFGTDEQLLEFGLILKKRQLQPAVVVSRSAYLELWPNEAEHVAGATYVIANGERRYRGSKEAGLERLWVVHREEIASSKAEFLDAVLSENNDRDDLDPIERAVGMETMVQELGGAGAVAAHYGKSAPWVSQQRKMLKLVPELQALVSSGEMSQREGYRIAGLPADEQVGEWQAELQRRKEEADRRKAAKALPLQRKEKEASAEKPARPAKESSGSGPSFSALNGDASAAGGSAEHPDGPAEGTPEFSALKNGGAERSPSTPDTGSDGGTASERSPAAGEPAVGAAAGTETTASSTAAAIRDKLTSALDPEDTFPDLPWQDLSAVAGLICHHMSADQAKQLARKLWALYPD